MKSKPRTSTQADEFISALHDKGWRSQTCFVDGGHTFELLSKGPNAKALLIQIYPNGHGFQVWRPITESNSILETLEACGVYGGTEHQTS